MGTIDQIQVGSVAELKVPCMGNPPGTPGICYEDYRIASRKGVSFIFPNGNYDGFSPEDVDIFLNPISQIALNYKFKNVNKLSEDFRNGVFPFDKIKETK